MIRTSGYALVCALGIGCGDDNALPAGSGAGSTAHPQGHAGQSPVDAGLSTPVDASLKPDAGLPTMPPMGTAGAGGASPCQPITCAAQGRTCGSVFNVCTGGQIACGTCEAPAFCGPSATCVVDVECLEGAAASYQGDVRVAGPAMLNELVGVRRVEGNLVIDKTPQADLAQLACLQEVTGDLRIGASSVTLPSGEVTWGDAGVRSLRGLAALTTVGGSLVLFGGTLVDLSGLEGLQSVGDGLTLAGLTQLASLTALAQLRDVSELSLHDLPALASLHGLEGVSRLPGWLPMNYVSANPSLDIGRCDGLRDLTGLNGLQHLGKLRLADNAALVSLDGLDSVRSVGCEGATFDCDPSQMSFEFDDNPELADLSALAGAAGAIGELRLYGSQRLVELTDLRGLQFRKLGLSRNTALVRISSQPLPVSSIDLYLNENTVLETLLGLETVTMAVGSNGINIRDNPALRDVSALSAVTQVRGPFIVRRSPLLAALDFPMLQSIMGNIYLEGLPMVARCEVEALLARVGAECTSCSGLDDAATCP